MTIRAVYTSNTIYYTVTYLDWNGDELYSEQVEKGGKAIGPSILPNRDGYTFIGWSKSLQNVQSNITVIAQYELAECLEDIHYDSAIPCKLMIDGQAFILRANKVYTIQGLEIK